MEIETRLLLHKAIKQSEKERNGENGKTFIVWRFRVLVLVAYLLLFFAPVHKHFIEQTPMKFAHRLTFVWSLAHFFSLKFSIRAAQTMYIDENKNIEKRRGILIRQQKTSSAKS